jgi:hypothetical protein
MSFINHFHNQALVKLLESANRPNSDFPIQHLPFTILRRKKNRKNARVTTGEQVIDLE